MRAACHLHGLHGFIDALLTGPCDACSPQQATHEEGEAVSFRGVLDRLPLARCGRLLSLLCLRLPVSRLLPDAPELVLHHLHLAPARHIGRNCSLGSAARDVEVLISTTDSASWWQSLLSVKICSPLACTLQDCFGSANKPPGAALPLLCCLEPAVQAPQSSLRSSTENQRMHHMIMTFSHCAMADPLHVHLDQAGSHGT